MQPAENRAARALGNHDEVDEVMQEIALAAATQASKQQPPIHRVGPWLYRVALRQVMLFRRKAGRGEN